MEIPSSLGKILYMDVQKIGRCNWVSMIPAEFRHSVQLTYSTSVRKLISQFAAAQLRYLINHILEEIHWHTSHRCWFILNMYLWQGKSVTCLRLHQPAQVVFKNCHHQVGHVNYFTITINTSFLHCFHHQATPMTSAPYRADNGSLRKFRSTCHHGNMFAPKQGA